MKRLMQRQTTLVNINDINRQWYLIDASGIPFGRLVVEIAKLLMGKYKVIYTSNVDCGDYVVVINAKNVIFTGNKKEDKEYYNVSGYPGGLRVRNVAKMMEKYIEELFKRATRNMMRKNRLAEEALKRLYIFEGPEHNKQAQKPVEYIVKRNK